VTAVRLARHDAEPPDWDPIYDAAAHRFLSQTRKERLTAGEPKLSRAAGDQSYPLVLLLVDELPVPPGFRFDLSDLNPWRLDFRTSARTQSEDWPSGRAM